MSKTQTKSKASKPTAKTIIMFGLDKDRKPHAARFNGESEALLTKAAANMGLRLAVPTTRKHFEVVNKLPVGRIHTPTTGLVPSIPQPLYEQIISLVGGETPILDKPLPKSWAELAQGQVVLAQDNILDGWWEAFIVKRSGETVTLKWRDYPTQSEFIRPLYGIALLKAD